MTKHEQAEFLTPEENATLSLYREPTREYRRAVRLSIQYLLGAGLFLAAAILQQEAWYALGTYLTFAALRLLGARRIGRSIPAILRKYEERMAALARGNETKGKA